MRLVTLPAALAFVLVAGCTSQPIRAPSADRVQATPSQVALTPERFHGDVLWGGSILAVENRSEHTEIEIFAWPLDAAQRPQPDDMGGGRFIAVMPGYAERMEYPVGSMITLRGSLAGVRSGRVGEAVYVFPLVNVAESHVWRDAPRDKSRVHFGVGLGIGIR